MVSKEEFARNYAEASGLTPQELGKLNFYVIRCNCKSLNCSGYQMHHGNVLKKWDDQGVSYGDGTRKKYAVAEMNFFEEN